MSKIERGIYSLKHKSLDGVISTVRIKDKNGKLKENFPLTTIDALTTMCDNMKDLLELIREINKPKKNSNDDMSDGHFYIEYKNNHEVKTLNVVFSDNIVISELSKTYDGLYRMPKNKTVSIWAYKLIKIRMQSPELYKYLKDHNYIDSYLSELAGYYIFYAGEDYQNPVEANRYMKEIIAKLESYKTFRDFNVGIYNYDKVKELKALKKQIIGDEPEIEKVKTKTLKGTQLKFSDIGYDI